MLKISFKNRKLIAFLMLFVSLFLVLSSPIIVHADDPSEEDADKEYSAIIEDGIENEEPSIVDDVAKGLLDITFNSANTIGNLILKLLLGAFEPTLNPLLNLESGSSLLTVNTNNNASTQEKIEGSTTFNTIWNFAFMFGIITCSLLFFINAGFLIAGQQDKIKDSPMALFARFCISVFLIYMSKYAIGTFIDLFGEIWTNTISFNTVDALGFAKLLPVSIDGVFLCLFGIRVFPMVDISGLIPTIIMVIGLFFGIKLLKEFISLYLEMAERYLVFILLLFFFPAAASTITSNNSKRVFEAYMRMIYCQGFLLLVNSVFIIAFINIAKNGGWVAGILNYLAAFAYLRVCQRVDAYMSQLGLNVAQTGTNLFGALGGAFRGAGSIMRGLDRADRARKNTGKALESKGQQLNNPSLSKIGRGLGTSLADIVTGNGNASSFNKDFAAGVGAVTADAQGHSGGGSTVNFGGDSKMSMQDKLAEGNVPLTFADQMAQAGIKADDIGSITQIDDNASKFLIQDGEGNTFAAINNDSLETDSNMGAMINDAKKDATNSSPLDPSTSPTSSPVSTPHGMDTNDAADIAKRYYNDHGYNLAGNPQVEEPYRNFGDPAGTVHYTVTTPVINKTTGVSEKHVADLTVKSAATGASSFSGADGKQHKGTPGKVKGGKVYSHLKLKRVDPSDKKPEVK